MKFSVFTMRKIAAKERKEHKRFRKTGVAPVSDFTIKKWRQARCPSYADNTLSSKQSRAESFVSFAPHCGNNSGTIVGNGDVRLFQPGKFQPK
jgi:hypothetical protein